MPEITDADVIYFDSQESAALFDSADVKSHFWSLCRFFESEEFMTYCGIASAVTVLNSLQIPSPDAPQIYPYRVFTQENFFIDAVLQIRRPVEVEKHGCSLDQLAQMVSVFDADVKTLRADTMTKDEFRKLLMRVLKASDQRVVVDFDRSVLGQKGHGHFSPLAAYNSGADRFLLMDVARYKLAPSWVTAEMLFKAMSTVDRSSGKSRGALIVCQRSSTST